MLRATALCNKINFSKLNGFKTLNLFAQHFSKISNSAKRQSDTPTQKKTEPRPTVFMGSQMPKDIKPNIKRGKESTVSKKVPEDFSKKQAQESNNQIAAKDENNPILYYELSLKKDFDIFDLRNFYYNYLVAKQKEGKLYINIDDSDIPENQRKNKLLMNFLKNLDYLGLDFNTLPGDEGKPASLFQSDRIQLYIKNIQFLIDNGSAFKCYCSVFEKCVSNCKSNAENAKPTDFKNEIFDSTNDFSVKYIRINKAAAYDSLKESYKKVKFQKSASDKSMELVIPSVNYQEYLFTLSDFEDFPIYKNYSKQVSPSLRSAVDDVVHNVTLKIESGEYSVEKDFLLSNLLLSRPKKYMLLPAPKIFFWNPDDFENLSVEHLKQKRILPEAILNTALMIGWQDPIKERKSGNAINARINSVITKKEAIEQFNLLNVFQDHSIFSSDTLYYYNNKYLNYFYFEQPREIYLSDRPNLYKLMKYPLEFKKEMLKVFELHKMMLDSWTERSWRKAIEIIIPNIKSYEYLHLFKFLFEAPDYNGELLIKYEPMIKRYFDSSIKSILFMHDLVCLLDSIEEFKGRVIDKRISEFIFNKFQEDKTSEINNRLVYKVLKVIISGSSKTEAISNVMDLLGKDETIRRCKEFNNLLSKISF